MTFPLAAEQQKLHDFAAESHPAWFTRDASRELLIGFAVLFDRARRAIDHYFDMTYVTRATRGASGDPDWLDGLAREINISRLAGEADPALQDRIRSPQIVITRPQLLSFVAAILAGAGIAGDPAMESVPLEAGFCLSAAAPPSEAAGHAFAFTPTTLVGMSRIASTKPFGFVLILPAEADDEFTASLLALLDEIRAGGFSVFLEHFA